MKCAARGSLEIQDAKMMQKNRHQRTVAQLCRAISSQLRHVSTIGKNLLSSNISPTCPYNMVNFGPLVAEIISLVWGTPANFNGFRSHTAALNRGHHLYSTERPSRCMALAHISSFKCRNPADGLLKVTGKDIMMKKW